jgi:hypothetical protein
LDKRCSVYLFGRTLLLLFLAGMVSCHKPVNEQRVFLKKWHFSFEDSLQYPRHLHEAMGSGIFYSRTNGKAIYSDGLSFSIPDSLFGENLRIKTSCLLRRAPGRGDGLVVVQINREQENLFYYAFYVNDYATKENTWMKMEDSTQVYLQGKIPSPGSATLKVYLWNGADFNVDLAELNVELYRIEPGEKPTRKVN